MMLQVEAMKEDVNEEGATAEEDQLSGEVCDTLSHVCRGTSQQLLRSVDDCRGMMAWQTLYQEYNLRTVARTRQTLGKVTWQKVTDSTGEELAMDRWEEQLKKVEKDLGLTFGDTMRIGIWTNFMPDEIKDYVYVNIRPERVYKEIADKGPVLIKNKKACRDTVPIGHRECQ